MPEFGILAGQTNRTIYFRLRDSTTGLGKTGLVFDSPGAVCSYTLPRAVRAAISLVTQTASGVHADGGFAQVDATNCKGLYRLDLPDNAIASGLYSTVSMEFDGVIEESSRVPLVASLSSVIAGQSNRTIYFRLRDSTTGLSKTGLVFDSPGAVCSYTLPGASRASISLVTQTASGVHADGGFAEVDATNCKGLYRLDLTDAAIESGLYSIISIEFDGVIEESTLIPLTASVTAVREDTPISDGLLSLLKGVVRDDIGKPKLFWDFKDYSSATDFSSGSDGTLTLSEKFDSKAIVSTVSLDSVTSQGAGIYRAIFAIDEAAADSLILAEDRAARMTFRVEIRHAASGAVLVPDGAHGDCLVK